jgi:hypothetical protein
MGELGEGIGVAGSRGPHHQQTAVARASAAGADPATDPPRPRALSAAELAWIALLPCAIVAVLAIVLLGPPLGHLLFPRSSDELWPPSWWEATGNPEPVKQARYLLALLAPALLVAVVLAGTRRPVTLRPRTVRALTSSSYAAVTALVAVALLEQHPFVLPGIPAPAVFDLTTVIAAALLLLVATLALRRPGSRARIAALTRETRTRRTASLAIAVGFLALWLLKAIMTDRLTADVVGLNLPYTFNDALAVLGGRTPLVDYHAIYSKLLPYPTSIVLATFGATAFVYTAFMALLSGLALLAVYAVFRRVTRSSRLALALFIPFVAISDLNCVSIAAGFVSPFTLSAMWPMRLGGAYLLAWLTVRHVDARWPQRAWILFAVGGLVTINNLEFGMAAVGASVVALLFAHPPRTTRAALRLAVSLVVGALAAIALVALITLIRAGRPPDPALLLEWPRVFTSLGWFSLPLRMWDLHLAIYATFVAALATAAVRVSRRDPDVLLTGMLAWSGVFGLLAGGYFIGRPDVLKLEAILSPWSFALSMLTIACVRSLAGRGWPRPALPQLLVLFGFALSLVSLSRLSLPQEQIARLARARPAPVYPAAADRFVGARTHPGETVVILLPMGARVARDLRLDNVAPYAFMNAIVTRSQMQTLLDTVRRKHVREIFTPAPGSHLMQEGEAAPQQIAALIGIGFRLRSSESGFFELRKARG